VNHITTAKIMGFLEPPNASQGHQRPSCNSIKIPRSLKLAKNANRLRNFNLFMKIHIRQILRELQATQKCIYSFLLTFLFCFKKIGEELHGRYLPTFSVFFAAILPLGAADNCQKSTNKIQISLTKTTVRWYKCRD